jgi:hypothetical protein
VDLCKHLSDLLLAEGYLILDKVTKKNLDQRKQWGIPVRDRFHFLAITSKATINILL